LRVGVRFLCEYREKDSKKTVFSCLTTYQYIWKRIQSNGIEIYSLIVDLKLSAGCQGLSDAQREILQKICLALESNVHVLQGSPHLLHSCLRNSPKAVQENVVIPPDVVPSTWMEWKVVLDPACEFPRDMSCFALSPDKKLLAGGIGKSISFFDASSLLKVLGPVEVPNNIHHLEFSPDGRFVFFGRLDKWLSVEKICVEEFPQFSGNCRCYKWASFVRGGRVITLQGDPLGSGKHTMVCLANLFLLWAKQELSLMQSMKSGESAFLRYMKGPVVDVGALLKFLFDLEREGIIGGELLSKWEDYIAIYRLEGRGCYECRGFHLHNEEATLSVVRKRVIDLYSGIFEYQVWDVQSGRPALEEAFSLDVLSPFCYLCHVASALDGNKALLSLIDTEGLSFFNVAFINFLSCVLLNVSHKFDGSFWQESFCVTNLPIEFQNRPAMESRLSLSLDGTWIAVRQSYNSTVCLFKKSVLEHFDFKKPDDIIEDVEQFAFTDDSCLFLYVIKHRSLHALSLQTSTILSRTSGKIPLYCTPEEHVGYLFHARGEEKIILARQFPRSFLSLFSFSSDERPLTVAFTSADTILTLRSFAFCGLPGVRTPFPANIHAKKAVFSPDGKLLATHRGTEILLLDYPTVLHFSFVGDCEHLTSYLAFSPDSSLFLYCISSSSKEPRFHVWDVEKKEVSASFDSPLGPQPVHCCCYSADSTKLILCCAFQISIWEYYERRPCRLLANVEPFGPFNEFDRFSHCTVSSDNELLACCIVDRILLYPLEAAEGDQTILQLPRAHLGRIEFCKFLKGTRYLISNGVDGTVFLWDLREWKAIAYARVAQGRETIVSLAVSPKEDDVVCFTSFGRLSRIKLCGLVNEMSTKFPSPDLMNTEKIAVANRQQLGEQQQRSSTFESVTSPVDDVEAMDVTKLLEDMNFMADENLESDDDIYESDSDE